MKPCLAMSWTTSPCREDAVTKSYNAAHFRPKAILVMLGPTLPSTTCAPWHLNGVMITYYKRFLPLPQYFAPPYLVGIVETCLQSLAKPIWHLCHRGESLSTQLPHDVLEPKMGPRRAWRTLEFYIQLKPCTSKFLWNGGPNPSTRSRYGSPAEQRC